MDLRSIFLLVLVSFVSAARYVAVGPRTTDRLTGEWPDAYVRNGTEDTLSPWYSQPLGEDILWCDKIQIPSPGMAIEAYGIYMDTAGINMKLHLYDDSELGRPGSGRQGTPLVTRTFTSVVGMNEFNMTSAERTTTYWTIPVGGSDFLWICMVHGVSSGTAPAANFFVTGGATTDGPKHSWVYTNVNYDWDTYTGALTYLQLKTNVWVYGQSLATRTDTPTQTSTATDSVTLTGTPVQSHTPTETATSTRSATATGTRTPTETAIPTHDPMYYIYNGVPAPSEVLTIPWVDYYPNSAMVAEEITARVRGFHNFWEHDIYFKIGRGIGYDDCYGIQEGSSIQLMVNNTIKLRANKADVYRVCYKLRNDWEPLERKFTVTDPANSLTFLGYNSCSELLLRNSSACGCYLGTVGEHVHVPSDFPLNLLLPRKLDKTIEMGCCVDNSYTRVTTGTGLEDWGWCTNDPNVPA